MSNNRIKPYGGTSAERMTALIKKHNPKLDKPTISFTFSTPTSLVGHVNTSLFVRTENTAPTTNPNGESVTARTAQFEEVQYTRLPLDVLNLLPPCEVLPVQGVTLPFTIHEVLPKINEALGLDLLPSEVKNHYYVKETDSFTLEINGENSLAWTPNSQYVFELHGIDKKDLDNDDRILEDGTRREFEDGKLRVEE